MHATCLSGECSPSNFACFSTAVPPSTASQFLNFSAPLGQLVGDELVAPLSQVRELTSLD